VGSLLEDIGDREEEIWLAFFSPSSAEMALDHFPCPPSPESQVWSRIKIGAIGETTAQFLVEYGLEVHAVAQKPTAEGLLAAIRAFKSA
jgi:uroporphyrinogen-III synthase